jgi:hypothetical protein
VGCVGSRVPTPNELCAQISDESARSSCESAIVSARATSPGGTSSFTSISLGGFALIWYVAYYSIGFIFARFVYLDAKRREWLAFRVRPLWWGALCIFDPAVGALVYWVLHYSRLARRGYA